MRRKEGGRQSAGSGSALLLVPKERVPLLVGPFRRTPLPSHRVVVRRLPCPARHTLFEMVDPM